MIASATSLLAWFHQRNQVLYVKQRYYTEPMSGCQAFRRRFFDLLDIGENILLDALANVIGFRSVDT